jgi:hypothetical protein
MAGLADSFDEQLKAQLRRGRLQARHQRRRKRVGGIHQRTQAPQPVAQLGHHLDRLGRQLWPLDGHSGDIAARPRQALHQPGRHRIAGARHHDRDAARGLLRCHRRRRQHGDDQVRLPLHQLLRERRQLRYLCIGIESLRVQPQVAAFAQVGQHRIDGGEGARQRPAACRQKADAPDLGPVLRTQPCRPEHGRAQQHQRGAARDPKFTGQ